MNSPILPAMPSGLDAALIDRAAPPGSMRYFSLLFTPAERREYLAAIYVIESELRDSALAGHDVAHVRLQWWREEVGRLAAARPQHPATRVLAAHPDAANIDFKALQETVTAAAMDLACATFETQAEVDRYLRHSGGALSVIAAQCLAVGNASERSLAAARQAGQLMRQTEILRDLRRDAARGRIYLPLAALDGAGIEHATLKQSNWPNTLVQLLQARSHLCLIELQSALDELTHSEKAALRPLIVLARLHAQLMQKMAQKKFLDDRITKELSAFDKLWTAWRAARAAR